MIPFRAVCTIYSALLRQSNTRRIQNQIEIQLFFDSGTFFSNGDGAAASDKFSDCARISLCVCWQHDSDASIAGMYT